MIYDLLAWGLIIVVVVAIVRWWRKRKARD